jgi:hypothetical protein
MRVAIIYVLCYCCCRCCNVFFFHSYLLQNKNPSPQSRIILIRLITMMMTVLSVGWCHMWCPYLLESSGGTTFMNHQEHNELDNSSRQVYVALFQLHQTKMVLSQKRVGLEQKVAHQTKRALEKEKRVYYNYNLRLSCIHSILSYYFLWWWLGDEL